MNGQLSERPLADAIREISSRSQSGRLRIEHNRLKIAAYFDKGKFVYAASNVRDMRLRGYLQKVGILSPRQLAQFNESLTDLQLAKAILRESMLTPAEIQEAQTRQISDILRFALTMTEGEWNFDSRSHLEGTVELNIDVEVLMAWAARRMPPKPVEEEPEAAATEPEPEDLETFLERLRGADSFYDVLRVDPNTSPQQLKLVYYELARRYHPDRFRKSDPALLTRIESAFARITQAYDTLRDERLRAGYDAKLQSRKKAPQMVEPAVKPATPATAPPPPASGPKPAEPNVSDKELAEHNFKEGFAALEQGQRSVATGLFASAARLAPNEPRYRAFYGQALAAQEHTRRAAETELQAAIKLDPGNAEYRVMLAELFRDLGFPVRARGEAQRALAADPNNRKARELLQKLKAD